MTKLNKKTLEYLVDLLEDIGYEFDVEKGDEYYEVTIVGVKRNV